LTVKDCGINAPLIVVVNVRFVGDTMNCPTGGGGLVTVRVTANVMVFDPLAATLTVPAYVPTGKPNGFTEMVKTEGVTVLLSEAISQDWLGVETDKLSGANWVVMEYSCGAGTLPPIW
jgi:hypothetical protein